MNKNYLFSSACFSLLTAVFTCTTVAGQAQFAAVSTYATGAGTIPSRVALGDVNGDNRLDIVTCNPGTSTVGVLLGQSSGAFATATNYATGAIGATPVGVAIGDVNGDGRLDIVASNTGLNTVGVLLGQAGGGFAPAVTYATGGTGFNAGPYGVALGDTNGDGRLDIVTGNYESDIVGVLLGQASGGFAPVATYSTGAFSYPYGVALGDVNGDSRLDIVTANNSTSTAGVLLGQAGGGFGAVSAYSTGVGSRPFDITLGDVNRDGRLDIVSANISTNSVGVLFGQAGGGFATANTYATGNGPFSVVLGDVNGDSRLDIVTVGGGSNTANVLLAQASGSFATASSYFSGTGGAQALALGDVDRDGRLDIVTANPSSNTVGVLLNTTVLAVRAAAVTSASLTVYPNPTQGTATVTVAVTNLPVTARHLDITLVNPLGQTIRQVAFDSSHGVANAVLPTANLASGIYLVCVRAHNAEGQSVERILVQRLSL